MKYFIVNTTIFDGEYEYFSQSPVQAETELKALNVVKKDAKYWTKDDYREYQVRTHIEISKKEFDVIKKYIY